MPDARLRRARATLPEGYQYGDAKRDGVRLFMSSLVMEKLRLCPLPNMHEMYRKYRAWMATQPPISVEDTQRWFTDPDDGWRAPHENAAAQLKRNQSTTFRLGVDTCPTCGTTGKYDCPDCGIPYYAKRNAQRTGEETI